MRSAEGERTGRAFDGKDSYDAGEGANFDYQDPFTLAGLDPSRSADGAILSRAEDYCEGAGYTLLLNERQGAAHITASASPISACAWRPSSRSR